MTASIPAPRLLSTLLGGLMIAAAAGGDHPLVAGAAAAGVAAVAVGIWVRAVATAAVLIAGLLILIADPGLGLVALAGAAATGYLLVRHAVGPVATVSPATLVGAAGFLLAAVLGALLPVRLAWLPLLAPVLIVAVYLLMVRPFHYSDTVSYVSRASTRI
ncbi:hypothetical protein [Mycolicibacterium thermoresistibile]